MKFVRYLSFLLSGLFILAMLILSGCAKETTSEKPFIYAVQADARTLDPQMSTDATSNNAVERKVYETLITIDQNNKVIPALATEWKQIDALTWEFTLRKGVKFHDGTDFNGAAVKASFDRLLDPAAKRNRRSMLASITEIKVIDSYKIQLITATPFAPLLLHLNHPGASIMSPKAIEEDKAGKNPLAQNPVGTGPFKFEKWIKGDQISYTRFDQYWGEKAKISKLIFKIVPEDTTRIAMVKTGEAQAANLVPVTEADRLSKDSAFKLIRTPLYRTEFIAFNTEKAPFNNPKVRRAIAEAIDFQGLISGVYNNSGTSGVSTLGPAVYGYNPNLKPYSYNLENAKKLLAEAGYPNGFTAKFYVADRKIRIKLAEVIQAELKSLGIELKIVVLEQGAFFAASEKGEHDLCIDGWSNSTGDADFCLSPTLTARGIPTGDNYSRYNNPTVTALLDQARGETNSDKRLALYYQAQEIIREDAPLLTTQVTEDLSVTRKNVEGLWITAGGTTIFNNVSVK